MDRMGVKEQTQAYRDYVDALVAFNVAEQDLAAKVAEAGEKRQKAIVRAKSTYILAELLRLRNTQRISLAVLMIGALAACYFWALLATSEWSGFGVVFLIGAVAIGIFGLVTNLRAGAEWSALNLEAERAMSARLLDE